jgi:hypothetical protein
VQSVHACVSWPFGVLYSVHSSLDLSLVLTADRLQDDASGACVTLTPPSKQCRLSSPLTAIFVDLSLVRQQHGAVCLYGGTRTSY